MIIWLIKNKRNFLKIFYALTKTKIKLLMTEFYDSIPYYTNFDLNSNFYQDRKTVLAINTTKESNNFSELSNDRKDVNNSCIALFNGNYSISWSYNFYR